MEFILRFFALSSEQFKQTTQESLSLKRLLDLYMKNHSNINTPTEDEMTARFVAAINKANQMFGDSAFHNISPSNNSKYVSKFSPTIFDSILIAIDSAVRRNIAPLPDAHEKKFSLLQDEAYRAAIAQETMRKTNINLRMNKACRYLFGADYE